MFEDLNALQMIPNLFRYQNDKGLFRSITFHNTTLSEINFVASQQVTHYVRVLFSLSFSASIS